nr:N-acetyl-1-D-myo-inositol-2-amino-2-deoxy-alpha-D-glucopyranoside deacetylase [Motilibacter aurantiacus]
MTTGTPEDGPFSEERAALDEAAAAVEATPLTAEAEREMAILDIPRRILLVHAHPDDESINNGVTMAKYAAEGAHVTLLTCTLGEEGEVLVPELAHLAADREDRLGEHRVEELATAMEALGVRDFRFLGGPGRWRDSGMMGLATNDRPDCFWQADLEEAARLVADVIREVRPQVLVTYDENGGYGHPDHIQAHRAAMRGLELAADPAHVDAEGREPWRTQKVYWNAMPESRLREGLRRLREAGDTTSFEGMDPEGEMPSFVVPDDQITAAVDGTGYVAAKLAAMRAHATQISLDGPFFALSNNLGDEVWAIEHYRQVRGERAVPDGVEDDLFTGL